MDIEKIYIHVVWNHVTVVPLVWQKKVLGQQGLTDINDLSGNTGQITLLFVDCKFMNYLFPFWTVFLVS